MSNLLKCLECRLVGAPPLFRMPPPPAPPAEFLLNLNLHDNKQITKQLKQIQLKRCLKVKNYLSNLLTNRSLNNNNLQQSTKSMQLSADENESITSLLHYLTPNQSVYIFLICFLVFLIVLTVAALFLYKLFSLRKQLKLSACKNTKTASLCSSLDTDTSSSNTISSHLVITPSSSLLLDSNESHKAYNLISLYDSAACCSSTNSTNNSSLFYNQLFESTKHLFAQSNQVSNSTTPLSCEHYLQAVPNNSNLIENHLNYKLHRTKQQQIAMPSEYDEINSQMYQIYSQNNQSAYDTNQMIIQPIFPMKQQTNYGNSAYLQNQFQQVHSFKINY